MNQENNNGLKEKSPSILFKIVKFIFQSLFPIFKLMSINKLLDVAETTYIPRNAKKGTLNYPKEAVWFSKQRRLNILWSIIVPSIFVISIFCGRMIISSNIVLMKGIEKVQEQAFKFNFKEAKNKWQIANRDPSVATDLNLAINFILIGLGLSIFAGYYVSSQSSITKGTKEFKGVLVTLGYQKEDDDNLVLSTPLGFLYQISSGGSPKEMAQTDRIWQSLNIRINDYVEHPDVRSIVFFKKAYQLKAGDEYGYDKYDG